MSVLTSLARANAAATGVAQPIATVRHVHLAEAPLVFVPLTLAGEANAPLAALVGTGPDDGRLLLVTEPRNRDNRVAFAAELAEIVLGYLDSLTGLVKDGAAEATERHGPQIVVPNRAGVTFVRELGRSTRFRRTDGDYPVAASVPLLGKWLTYAAERAEFAGSCLLLAMTEALSLHWATGQSPLEDANLAALWAWIQPPTGQSGRQAALAAEDPLTSPPAGPTTDPTFDNALLEPAISEWRRASSDAARQRARDLLASGLLSQVQPTWELIWQAIARLRALAPGPSVRQRWALDCDDFAQFLEYLETDGRPQPRRDGAVAAARRHDRLERAATAYAAQRALDDPLVLAEQRITGEAFEGVVVSAEPLRTDSSGARPRLRPHLVIATDDPVQLAHGTAIVSPARPHQSAGIVEVATVGPHRHVTVELRSGMGRRLTPAPGSVAEVGERVAFTSMTDERAGVATNFPPAEQTPWTHGGPPSSEPETGEDAVEAWA